MSIRKFVLVSAFTLSAAFNNVSYAQETSLPALTAPVSSVQCVKTQEACVKRATLVVLRHGESTYNRLNLKAGQRDVPLTPQGEDEAREAGVLMRGIHFDKVYTSNLSRAIDTATLALAAAGSDLQAEQRKEIAEIDFGRFTGLGKKDPEIVNFVEEYDKPFPGGESEKQLVERVQEFFGNEVMPRLLRGENVLLVTHSGVARALAEIPETGIVKGKGSVPNAVPGVYKYENGILKSSYFIEPAPANENTAKPIPAASPSSPR